MWTNPDLLTTVLNVIYGIIHDLSVATYIGGAIAMDYVLGPAQNSIPPAQAQVMGQKTADRFLWLVWGSLGLIITTAILRLDKLGHISLTSWPILGSDMSLGHDYGRTIWAMFALWCVLVANGLIMTFYLRPRLSGKLKAGTTTAGVQASMASKMEAAKWRSLSVVRPFGSMASSSGAVSAGRTDGFHHRGVGAPQRVYSLHRGRWPRGVAPHRWSVLGGR